MRGFASLFLALDASTSTTAKVEALVRYFGAAAPQDAAWAVYFFAGGKPRQAVNSRALREFAVSASGLPDWLFEESYQAVGDLAETIAHLLPPPSRASALGLASWIEERLLPLRGLAPIEVLERLRGYAEELEPAERFLLIKLIGGGFRVGVSKLLVTRALAQHAKLDAKRVAERLVGYTDAKATPSAERYLALIDGAGSDSARGGTPYPFFLAFQLDGAPESLGAVADWHVEWKYDGIRAQLVRRDGQTWLWSRGEELITERFPEIAQAAGALPDGTVLDGEVLVWDEGAALPAAFARLQTRITRKTVTPRVQREHPARLVVYDLLEDGGVDLREQPQEQRRVFLQARVASMNSQIALSPLVTAPDWSALAALRAESRARGVEGFMLKHRAARYGVGRTKTSGAWWKWKIEPMTVDAVLVYAQRGHGRRASLYTDYTFAVWDRAPVDTGDAQRAIEAIGTPQAAADLPRLVPFAKAYSGLTDEEIRQVDAVIRKTTIEKFGPVRTVTPTLVFELGFEGIQRSARHKSGIAVRFPRMLRWRQDKPVHEADTLAQLQLLLGVEVAPARGGVP
jgi:DNA ligase-1